MNRAGANPLRNMFSTSSVTSTRLSTSPVGFGTVEGEYNGDGCGAAPYCGLGPPVPFSGGTDSGGAAVRAGGVRVT